MTRLLAVFALLLAATFLTSDALQCHVGRLSLRRGSNRDKDVMPTVQKCPPEARCCKSEIALDASTWSCATDCPETGEKCGFEENHSWCWCLSHTNPMCDARESLRG